MPNSSKKMVAIRNERGKVMGYIQLYWSESDRDYVLTPPKYTRRQMREEKPITSRLRYYTPQQVAAMCEVHIVTV